jgi:predicted RNase H-like HicB family nuclease
MKASNNYLKVVEWSEADQCYIGSCPNLMYGGCHGDNEKEVFDELCDIVDEIILLYENENKELPTPTVGKDLVNKILNAEAA